MIKITVTPDPADLARALAQDVNKAIRAGMINLAAEIEARAKKQAPVATGDLARSIVSNVSADGMSAVITTALRARYPEYVHEGTGKYGPRKTPIVPVNGKALFWPGAKHPVKSVKGMKPRPFFSNALSQINPQDVFNEGIRNYLAKQGR